MRTMQTPLDQAAVRDLVRPIEPVASVYVGLAAAYPTLDAEEDLGLRWRAVAQRLATQGADGPTLAAVVDRLNEFAPQPGELALFAAGGRLLCSYPVPGAAPFDRAGYGSPPVAVPLLAWLQRHPAHVVVCTDRAGAEVTAVAEGRLAGTTTVVVGPDDEIERNAPGGWSQPRYQRRAEDSWRHNAGAVAHAVLEAIRQTDARLLLVAGDVRAVQLLRDHLPHGLRRDLTLRLLPGGRGSDGSAATRDAARIAAVQEYATKRAAAALAALRRNGGPHGTAVAGTAATLASLAAGRVHALFLADDQADERVAWFGPDLLCAAEPVDGPAPLTHGRLTDVAVRAALLTGAQVWVTERGELADDIGALCRFPA